MGLIRFLLACFVVIFHSSPQWGFMPGDLSVQCFYVISGFYMALILNEKYTSAKSNFLFYSNRALKIYPIYFTTLIMLVLWAGLVFYKGYPSTFSFYHNLSLPFTTLLYLILINVLLIGFDTVFYFSLNKNGAMYYTPNIAGKFPYLFDFTFNSFAWTISIELMFYIIAPFIARRKLWVPCLLLLLSLLARIYCTSVRLDYPPWTYMFFPNQLMFFMGGIISYHLYKQIKNRQVNYKLYALIYVGFLATILLYSHFFNDSYLKQAFLFSFEIIAIPFIFIISKNVKADRFLGNLSFPIYLSQSLIMKVTIAKSFPKLINRGFTVLVLTIILSICLEFLIARPIEKYRQKRVIKSNAALTTLSL